MENEPVPLILIIGRIYVFISLCIFNLNGAVAFIVVFFFIISVKPYAQSDVAVKLNPTVLPVI